MKIDDAPHKRAGLRAFGDRGLFQDIPNPGNNGCKNLFIKRIPVAKVDMTGGEVQHGDFAAIQDSDPQVILIS